MRWLIILIALSLTACTHAPVAKVQTVEVKVPVAMLTRDQLPALPPQLGPRPPDARDGEAVALAGRCEAIAFVIRAWPLLLLSAGLPPAQAPDYPECDKH